MKKKFVAVAGTMGVGKTTMVKIIAEEFNFVPILENFAENPFLPKFYTDMKRWAFHSQMFFLIEKIKQINKIDFRDQIVQDTPIFEDVYSYAKAQHILKNMSKDEWNLYCKTYDLEGKNLQIPDLIIFLSCSVDSIYERVIKRNRSFETEKQKKNFINYLSILDKLNRDWIKKFKKKTKIFTVDTDGFNYLENLLERKRLIKILKAHLA